MRVKFGGLLDQAIADCVFRGLEVHFLPQIFIGAPAIETKVVSKDNGPNRLMYTASRVDLIKDLTFNKIDSKLAQNVEDCLQDIFERWNS